MADWNVELPAEAVEGADPHVEDHNTVYDAIKEVRTNVDEIELTPGEDGHSPEITWDGTTIVVDGSAGPDLKGDPGDPGEDGSDAEPQFTEEEVAALKALIKTPEAKHLLDRAPGTGLTPHARQPF